MKHIKRLYNYLFNPHLGYCIGGVMYYYDGSPYIGYVLYSKYRFCGIVGHTRIAYCYDREDLNKTMDRLNICLN